MNTEILGFIAGSLVAVSLVRRVIKSIKTKSTAISESGKPRIS